MINNYNFNKTCCHLFDRSASVFNSTENMPALKLPRPTLIEPIKACGLEESANED